MRTRNVFTTYKTFSKISIYNKKGEKVITKIDNDFLTYAKKLRWFISKIRYVSTGSDYLHRIVLGCPKSKIVDHINRDILDNRKCNLRVVSAKQNGINRKSLNKNNTSGNRGVWWHSMGKRWCAEIKVDRKKIWVGLFKSIEEAVKARKNAEVKYWGKESKYANI